MDETPRKGRAWKYGDDIDTDQIFPGRYLDLTDPNLMKIHAFETIDPSFPSKISLGDFIVAGKNFGCGSSREQAAIVLRENGISAVVAKSFARIFYRNAINLGIPPIIAPVIVDASEDGDLIELRLVEGTITNSSKDVTDTFSPFPPQIVSILTKGGLIPYLKEAIRQKPRS